MAGDAVLVTKFACMPLSRCCRRDLALSELWETVIVHLQACLRGRSGGACLVTGPSRHWKPVKCTSFMPFAHAHHHLVQVRFVWGEANRDALQALISSPNCYSILVTNMKP